MLPFGRIVHDSRFDGAVLLRSPTDGDVEASTSSGGEEHRAGMTLAAGSPRGVRRHRDRRFLSMTTAFIAATVVLVWVICVFPRQDDDREDGSPPGAAAASAIRAQLMTEVAVEAPTQAPPPGPRPTLFCWSHMRIGSMQENLVQEQLKRRAGIFSCNDFAVVSSKKVVIGEIDGATVETWGNVEHGVFIGTNNTEVYRKAWNMLWDAGVLWPFDFVAKVDPETLFVPYRLRELAAAWVDKPVYFPNCGDFDSASGPQLRGTIEVFSLPAMHNFMAQVSSCQDMPWEELGEDEFMKRCMDKSAVRQASILKVSDQGCSESDLAPCKDISYIAFGGMNSVVEWTDCLADSETTTSTTTWTTTHTTSTLTTSTSTYTTSTPPGAHPTLFCWSHMEFGNYEEKLIRQQFERGVSIFECNDFAVITSHRFVIGHIDGVEVETWYNPEKQVGMGKYGVNGQKTDSFLNTKTFLDAWDTLMNSGKIWAFDFVVKADPDAVFFPSRLRARMKEHLGDAVYVPNCGKWTSGPKLYGSIEVFSIPAMRMYEKRVNDCKSLPWEGWGEDYYMQHCMDAMGVKKANDFNQVGDDRCMGAPCSDWTKVAFHPFKNISEWFACHQESITTTTTTVTKTTTTTSTRTTSTSTITTTTPPGPSPKLFCWTHMEAGSYEEKLIKFQFKRRASLFACNEYAVISSKKMVIGYVQDGAPVETWFNPESQVDMGHYGMNGQKTDSFLNTKTFLDAWDTLINSGHMWPFDFVIKVDPDAVFLPDRLRPRLKDHVGQELYMPNCGKWTSGAKLYGSLEVFSVPALQTYAERVQECKSLPWQGWGEDYYMQHCMDSLGVMQSQDFKLVGDDRCVPADCSDWSYVAYHDFKEPETWEKCFKTAIGEGSEEDS